MLNSFGSVKLVFPNPNAVTKAQVGLGDVDNESKAAMFTAPSFTGAVSLAGVTLPIADGVPGSVLETDGSGNGTWSASATSHIGNQTNPHAITKAQVGLGNVDNESKATMFTAPSFTGVVSLETIPGQQGVAIGLQSGQTNQGAKAVTIGLQSGQTNQGARAVAIGFQSGQTNQGARSIAIGAGAGGSMQGEASVCIGNSATSEFTGAICLGRGAVATANDMLVLGTGIVGGVPGAPTAGLTIRIDNTDYYIALTAV